MVRAITTNVPDPEVVGEDEDDVGFVVGLSQSKWCKKEQAEQKRGEK
jgi:hypothetical protein